MILIFTSFVVTIIIEYIFSLVEGTKLSGPQNVLLCVLPAIIANDLIQYGFKRTGGGIGISLIGTSLVAVPIIAFL